MAKFQVEQKVEVWYSTTVEADNYEEAIELATSESNDNWKAGTEINWTDDYWVRNQDTDQIWIDNGNGEMEESEV